MNRCFVVVVALTGLFVGGCEKQPAAPSGEPASSPSPSSSAAATPSPLTTPTATPEATPTPTPEAASTPTPEATPTPATETAPAPSPSSSPSAAESETRPTLSSRSANEYLQSYDDYISDFKTAYKAMKEGDMTKYRFVIQRAQELQTKSEKLAGELNPEEEQRFANYLNKKANELSQFASQNH
jgi:hypothetical protein